MFVHGNEFSEKLSVPIDRITADWIGNRSRDSIGSTILCISAGTPMALYCPRATSAGTILSSGSPFQLALPCRHLAGSSLLDNHPHKQGPELLDTCIYRVKTRFCVI